MALLTLSRVDRISSPVLPRVLGPLGGSPAQAAFTATVPGAVAMPAAPLTTGNEPDGRTTADERAAARQHRAAAPLRPMDRTWAKRWATQLDAGRRLAEAAASGASASVAPASGARASAVPVATPAPERIAGLLRRTPRQYPVPTPWPSTRRYAPLPGVGPRSNAASPGAGMAGARRLIEVLADLSPVLDGVAGRPPGHASRTAAVAARLAEEVGSPEDRVVELALAGLLVGHLHAALAIGLPAGSISALAQSSERWDGRGPRGMARDGISEGARILAVAEATVASMARRPQEVGERWLRRRRGRQLDPDLTDLAICLGRLRVWVDLDASSALGRLLAVESPLHARLCDEHQLDRVCTALAASLAGDAAEHSGRLAVLADGVGETLHLDGARRRLLRRAALLHQVGSALEPAAPEPTGPSAQLLGRVAALATCAPLVTACHGLADAALEPAPAEAPAAEILLGRILAICDRWEELLADSGARRAGRLPDTEATAGLLRALESEVAPDGRALDPVAGLVIRALRRTLETGDRDRPAAHLAPAGGTVRSIDDTAGGTSVEFAAAF